MIKKNKKVLVAMSGGVDSSVVAALLKKQGYEVIGIFMHFWKESTKNETIENKCCSAEAYEDLQKICHIIDIPLHTINAEKEFKKEVVDYFLQEYKNGKTPNPCIVCNREIKFKLMLKKMLEMEADYIATGHYALIRKFKIQPCLPAGRISKVKTKKKFIYKLYEAKDKNKDQSYFLYTLNQKQLARIIFPLSNYNKEEVRKIAKDFGLPVFSKKESQDICFISSNVESFLKKYVKLKKGKIVDENGNVLGEHSGLPLYTIGQRKGINIGGLGPFYVYSKDWKKNVLRVTNDAKNDSLYTKKVVVRKVNWVDKVVKMPTPILVKTRYRNPLVSAIIKAENAKNKTKKESFEIIFDQPQRAITAGQSVVFYGKRREVLGGGIMDSA